MKENELYPPIKEYLEGQGYVVHGEVRDVDIVARHPDQPDEIIAIELKTRMSLDLVVQAARRKEITDAVYVAVPVSGSRGRLRNGAGVRTLLKRLEVGLILVRYLKNSVRVEICLHPGQHAPRRRKRRRSGIIREIDGRYAEFDLGGTAASGPRMTSYRQASLLTAFLVDRCGTASPRTLRAAGAPQTCGQILARNVYGWFDRVSRGVYGLHPAGEKALTNEADTVAEIVRTAGV